MTALVADIRPDGATILTDTLSSLDGGKAPAGFTTKIHVLPHLRMAMASIGAGSVGDRWFLYLNSWLGQDIVEIDKVAPSRLNQLWQAHLMAWRGRSPGACHIVHFGFASEPGQGFRVFEYHSGAGFQSQGPGVPVSRRQLFCLPGVDPLPPPSPGESYQERMLQILHHQQKRFLAEGAPAAVGGEVQRVDIQPNLIASQIIHRFEDFDETLSAIRQRLDGDQAKVDKLPKWIRWTLRKSGRVF